MNRFWISAALVLLAAASAAAQESAVRLSVSGVKPGGGTIYAAVFDTADGYRKNVPFRSLALQPASPVVEAIVTLPPGEYVFSLYQDLNSNGKLDTNFIGIRSEEHTSALQSRQVISYAVFCLNKKRRTYIER